MRADSSIKRKGFCSISFFIFWAAILLFTPAAFAQFTYSPIDDGAAIEITGYTGEGGNVVIPAAIDNLPVTSIGDESFYRLDSIVSVSIPDSVTRIGEMAFYHCSNLAEVAIPNRVTSIGFMAFSQCAALTNIVIPASVVEIESFAFGGCANLAAIQVDEENPIFASQDGLLFDRNRTAILCCPGGKTGVYTVPNSVTLIGGGSFEGCAGLTKIVIPAGVTTIQSNPFESCSNLLEISVDVKNPNYSSRDGVFFNKSGSELLCYPGGKDGDYTIPDGVTTILDFSFTNCPRLTGVSFPSSVTQIGGWAFAFCVGLTKVVLPAGLTNLSSWIFNGCTGLKEITIPAGITSIGGFAFYGCSSLSRIAIPDRVTSIGNLAFYKCSSLTEIAIPFRVIKIGASAFSGCSGLTGAYFSGDAPVELGKQFFDGCAESFSIYYREGKNGWATPTWNGYPAQPFSGPSSILNWERY